MPKYRDLEYRRLDRETREVRLLELLPMTGPRHARIPECRLIQTSLLGRPQYTALSYAWGDTKKNHVVIVDGIYCIRIPQNLFDALIALRPTEGTITMWIDFLCINQRNDAEKSWQVALMRDIYSQAAKVLAWLGPTDQVSEGTMRYLDAFGEKAEVCGFQYNPHVANGVWRGLSKLDTLDAKLEQNLLEIILAQCGPTWPETVFEKQARILLGISHASTLTDLFYAISGWHSRESLLPVHDMKRLFERAWWTRVWVLQEIALSEEADFICGSVTISRDRFCAAINAYAAFWAVLMKKHQDNDGQSFQSYHYQIITDLFHFRPAIMTNAWRLYKVGRFPLVALLRLTCVGSINLQRHGPHHLESSDPRDRIFALLGLASDQEHLEIYPDYTLTCQEVYVQAVAALLRQGHLSLLSHIQYPKTQNHLPSWVPDWSRPVSDPLQIVEDDHISLTPKFFASGSTKQGLNIMVIRQGLASWSLTLDGYVYDRVCQTGRFPRRVSTNEVPLHETWTWAQEWLHEILRLSYRTTGKFSSFGARLRAVARTSVGGAAYVRAGELSRVGDTRFVQAAFLISRRIDNIKHTRAKTEFRRFLARAELKKKFKHLKLLSLRLQSDINGRSLERLPFVTDKGHLGLGRDNTHEGDYVAIFQGAEVPYILRLQETGAYEFVCEAYVDNIMDGEVLDVLDPVKITLE